MREQLCNGLSPATTERIVEGMMPEAPALFTEAVPWTHPAGVPSTYLLLKDDRAVAEPVQRQAIQTLTDPAVVELPSGHLPMLSHPDALAAALARVAPAQEARRVAA